MRSKWQLRKGADNFIIVRRGDIYPPELVTAAPRFMDSDYDRWLTDAQSRQIVLEMYERLHGRSINDLRRASAEELRRSVGLWLKQAFARRELVAVLIPKIYLAQSPADESDQKEMPAPASSNARAPSKQFTWIEIELIDAQGVPVLHERFRLELPDGAFHEGVSDALGLARIDGIDPGMCELNFPDRDLRKWRAA